MLLGLLFAPFALSIGMLILLLNALVNRGLPQHFNTLMHHPAMWSVMAVFFLYLLSGWNSEDISYYLQRLRIKLPFLILPIAFIAIPRLDKPVYFRLLSFFFWLIVLTCLIILGIYFSNWAYYNHQYEFGKIMPTPVQHIRFSLLVCVAFAAGVHLREQGFYWKFPGEKQWTGLALLFLIVFLHILAVRSGLLALYALLFFYTIRYIARSRRWWAGIGMLMLGSAALFAAYRLVPTFQNRVHYTLYSIDLFRKGQDLRELSDSHRLGSIVAGWDIANAHPWTGVGIGDIKNETTQYLEAHYPEIAGYGLMPHNQFLFVYTATGLIGLGIFVFATCYPLFYRKSYRDCLFASLQIIYISSFLVEHTLETQIGTAAYLFFQLAGIRHADQAAV